jgi:hypothetical protein
MYFTAQNIDFNPFNIKIEDNFIFFLKQINKNIVKPVNRLGLKRIEYLF